jgi:hypothetical protein
VAAVIELTLLDFCQKDVKSSQQDLDEWPCSRYLLHQSLRRPIGQSIYQHASRRAALADVSCTHVVTDPGKCRKHHGMLRWRRRNKERQHAEDVRRSVRYRSPTGRANCCTEREKEEDRQKDIMCNSEAAGQQPLINQEELSQLLFSLVVIVPLHFRTKSPRWACQPRYHIL